MVSLQNVSPVRRKIKSHCIKSCNIINKLLEEIARAGKIDGTKVMFSDRRLIKRDHIPHDVQNQYRVYRQDR